MFNKLLKQMIFGVAMGSTIFNLMLLSAKLLGGDGFFELVASDYVRQSLCAIFVAAVFSVLGIIYAYDQLSFGLQVFIHMGGGLMVYFLVACYAQWLPIEAGLGILLFTIIFMIVVSFLIWFGFYLYHKRQARQMNAKISKLKP